MVGGITPWDTGGFSRDFGIDGENQSTDARDVASSSTVITPTGQRREVREHDDHPWTHHYLVSQQ